MSKPRYATFREAIEANAARAPDAPFVLAPEPDAVLTWHALASSCDAFASATDLATGREKPRFVPYPEICFGNH